MIPGSMIGLVKKFILPKSDITIARLHSNVKQVELVTAGGDVSLQLKVDSEASDITVATTDRRADIQSVQSNLEALKLKSGDGNFEVNLKGNNKVAGFNIEGPIGTGSIKSLGARTAS